MTGTKLRGVALLRGALLALLFVCAAPLQSACADIRVSGVLDAVRVEAREASLDDVLGALATLFAFRYRAKIPLDRPVNGIFSGSLSRVLSRLLDGYDHVVKRGPGGVEVLILGRSAKAAMPGEFSGFVLPNLKGANV